MTCVIGMIEGDKVYMGADSAGVAGLALTVRKDPKVFINGDYLIGYTSSFRMGQLLMYASLPKVKKEDQKDIFKFMVQDFIPRVRSYLNAGGYSNISNNVETIGVFLVGVKGHLFRIEEDLQVAESHSLYESVGCGAPFALGAFHAMRRLAMDDRLRVLRALAAAEAHSTGVRRPFTVVRGGKP